MIITCNNCNKKFNVDVDLIPEKGRLLECSSCKHQWFFKHSITPKFKEAIKNENFEIFEPVNIKTDKILDNDQKINIKPSETVKQVKIEKKTKKKEYKILNLTIVFIITFIALIILMDTFKSPLSKIFPNVEFLLYNLYESINDILLFIKDLI
tara:strand:+ start:139 stop:597 length:459 start_codon:yes stop_codon:yes gene_type:complete